MGMLHVFVWIGGIDSKMFCEIENYVFVNHGYKCRLLRYPGKSNLSSVCLLICCVFWFFWRRFDFRRFSIFFCFCVPEKSNLSSVCLLICRLFSGGIPERSNFPWLSNQHAQAKVGREMLWKGLNLGVEGGIMGNFLVLGGNRGFRSPGAEPT